MFLAAHERAAQIAIALFADIAEPVPAFLCGSDLQNDSRPMRACQLIEETGAAPRHGTGLLQGKNRYTICRERTYPELVANLDSPGSPTHHSVNSTLDHFGGLG
jgi:hypothetical protein